MATPIDQVDEAAQVSGADIAQLPSTVLYNALVLGETEESLRHEMVAACLQRHETIGQFRIALKQSFAQMYSFDGVYLRSTSDGAICRSPRELPHAVQMLLGLEGER